MANDSGSEKQYRAIDIEALQRIVEPLEEEIKEARRMVDENTTEAELENYLVQAMETLIFDTLDEFPNFSALINSLEERCNKLGVTLYEKEGK